MRKTKTLVGIWFFSRQYLFGIIGGYMQPSISLARKICDKLEVEDTRLIFPDGSIHYPDFVTADKFEDNDNL